MLRKKKRERINIGLSMRLLIGIDPDVDKNGFASWDCDKQDFTAIESYGFYDLLENLLMLKKHITIVRIEAGWLNVKSNYHPAQSQRMREKIAKNVGENHRVGKLIVEFCDRNDIPVELVKPLGKVWKSHEQFKRDVGNKWSVTNQDKRDAAFLVWNYN